MQAHEIRIIHEYTIVIAKKKSQHIILRDFFNE